MLFQDNKTVDTLCKVIHKMQVFVAFAKSYLQALWVCDTVSLLSRIAVLA